MVTGAAGHEMGDDYKSKIFKQARKNEILRWFRVGSLFVYLAINKLCKGTSILIFLHPIVIMLSAPNSMLLSG